MIVFWPEVSGGRSFFLSFPLVAVEDVERGTRGGRMLNVGFMQPVTSFALCARTGCFTTFLVWLEGVPSDGLYGGFISLRKQQSRWFCGYVEEVVVVGFFAVLCVSLVIRGPLGTPTALGMMQDAFPPDASPTHFHFTIHQINHHHLNSPIKFSTVQTRNHAS